LPSKQPEPGPHIVGVTADDCDEREAYERATAAWNKTKHLVQRRENQRIEFDHGPVCLTFAADLHFGSGGVDYERVFREAETVAKTPGMYLVLLGDLIDNFIIPKLVHARHRHDITVEGEWALLRKYLRLVAPKLLVSVGGNHEKWTWILSAVDYFKEVLFEIKGDAIYDQDDVVVTVSVGKTKFPVHLRHKWAGNSIYNPTHGIERSFMFEHDFSLGVGAHTHACGVARGFNTGSGTGLAILCGSYKRVDSFARASGFRRPNASTAMSAILFENGAMIGVDRVDLAAQLMRDLRKK
jgi:hypothetical protein